MRIYLPLTLILLVLATASPAFSQEKLAYNDTSYFMPSEIDFNLINSASRGHIENVRSLIQRGANVNAATENGVTSLMYAADNGDLAMVKLLLTKGANPNLQPATGITALMSAVLKNSFDVAEYLASHGANPNLRNSDGITALNYAAAYNFFEIVDMLLFYKANPDIADNWGNTPLISAAFNNCPDALEILIRNGANMNTPDKNGFTPLMVSIQQGNQGISNYLLEHGADIKAVNKAGMTALAFAVKASDYNLTKKLIEMGADVNHKINGSLNILELARQGKDEELIELLAAEGAKQNHYPNFNRFTAGAGLNFNGDDFITSVNFGIADSKYGFAVHSGFAFRPAAVRVLRDESSSLAYQYWEHRYYFNLGLSKNFAVYRLRNNITTGPVLRIDEIYTFGDYRGSHKKPSATLKTMPFAGWFVSNEWMDISLKYQYLNFNTDYISKGRVSLDIDILFPMRKKRTLKKRIRWLTSY